MSPAIAREQSGIDTTAAEGPLRVVVIGAGFGGIEAVRALAKSRVAITLVDRRNFHLFQPLLYQVATAALSPGDIAWPIRSIFAHQANVTTVMMDVKTIDPFARTVGDGSTTLRYDRLIVATGATHAYFGNDAWANFAPGLKSIDDALRLRGRMLAAFERAELAPSLAARDREMTVVVVGGGATGVEMAGVIAELARRTLATEFRRVDPTRTRIVLLEAGPRVLAAFPPALSTYACRSLAAMGVDVRAGTTVIGCDADGVILGGGERIAAATVVWAAGVQASPAARWLGVDHDKAGRVRVARDLSVPELAGVYVIGDTATIDSSDGRPVPGVAPAAKQMGRYVGERIAAEVAGRPMNESFVYRNQGDLATIGRRSAIVKLGGIELTGFVGWLFWCGAHVLFLVGFRSRFTVAFNWFWTFLTDQRGVRLISDGDVPDRARRTAP